MILYFNISLEFGYNYLLISNLRMRAIEKPKLYFSYKKYETYTNFIHQTEMCIFEISKKRRF